MPGPGKRYVSEFAEWLDTEIERRGISKRQAATQAGLNPGTLSGIINTGRISYVSALKIARLFRMPEEAVLARAGLSDDDRVIEDGDRDLDEEALLADIRALTDEQRDSIAGLIRVMLRPANR